MSIIGSGIAATISQAILLVASQITIGCQREMKEANSVSVCDAKVRKNFGLYLTIAVPNVFILLIPQFVFEVMALTSGFFGVSQQAIQILLFNLNVIMYQIPAGLKVGKCAIVGRQIGQGNADEAKRISKTCMKLALLIDAVEFCLLYLLRDEILHIFIKQTDLHKPAKVVIWAILLSIAVDFIQSILCGSLNALGKQMHALCINIVTYTVFVIPLAYYFAFFYGEHEQVMFN